jgi:hypothetical protein
MEFVDGEVDGEMNLLPTKLNVPSDDVIFRKVRCPF